MKRYGKYLPGGVMSGPMLAITGNDEGPEHILTEEELSKVLQGLLTPEPQYVFVPQHLFDKAIAEAKLLGLRTDNIKPTTPLPILKTEVQP